MSEKELNRWIRRIALVFVVLFVAFVAFYAVDRFRAPATPMVDKQLAALEDAIRANPADIKSRGQLADLYFAKRRFQDAITQYTALIEAKSNVELASLGRGNAYRELTQFDSAITDYNTVIAIASVGEMAKVDPNLEAAYYGLGMIAIAQAKPAEAVDHFSKATAITPTDADALFQLGNAYVAAGQADKAISPLRKAVALVPVGWADPYQAMAAAYKQLAKPELEAWATAMIALETRDYGSAKTQLEALTSSTASEEAMVGLGLLYEVQHDFPNAQLWYGKALALDATNEPAQLGFKRVGGKIIAAPTAAPSAAASPSAGN